MVGGLAGGWKLLAPLARLLARRHEVILYGLRGDRGPSSTSGPETIGDHARDLAFLIDRLGLERPSLFGVSFGGAVALEYAAEHPGRLGSLTLLGVEARYQETLRRGSPARFWNVTLCRATTPSSINSLICSTAARPVRRPWPSFSSSVVGTPTKGSWRVACSHWRPSMSPIGSIESTRGLWSSPV